MLRTVLFLSAPLSLSLDKIQPALVDDEFLHKVIVERSKELANEDIETFYTEKNMIVTQKGYEMVIFNPDEEPIIYDKSQLN